MMTEAEVQRYRKETDGVSKVIHLNNAGAALPPNVVKTAVLNYQEEEMTIGGYEVSALHGEELDGVYDSIAKLLNAKRNEIAVLESATVAWQAAFLGIDWQDGDVILATSSDYASNYMSYLHLQRDVNIEIKLIPNDALNQPDVNALEPMLSDRVKLVSVTHMPTNSGMVANAEAIGQIVKGHKAFYLLDACQTAGQYPLDVEKIGCDMLSATSRKYIRGPRGMGFLFVSEKIIDQITPHCVDLHSAEWTGSDSYEIRGDARKFENWEGNRAGVIGLKEAVDYINEIGIMNIWERVQYLGDFTRKQLAKIDRITVRDIGEVKGGIVSFTMDGKTGDELQKALFKKGINIWWNAWNNTLLDMDKRGLTEIARASVHYYNTEADIDALCDRLREMR